MSKLPADKDPTLEEFVATCHRDIDRFAAFYREQQAKVKAEGRDEHWPDRMGEADWFEQFVAHMAVHGE